MKLKSIILAALLLPLAMPLAAQGLPALGKASEITTGELPNGISYYIVSNKSLPGFADFAIVQPGRTDRTGPREDLENLRNMRERKPWRFLADCGVHYGARGYVQHLRDATVMRFESVPVRESAVYDTTLLMLMDLTRSSSYRQALMVSGDVDVSAVRERLRILSMTVPPRIDGNNQFAYTWRTQDGMAVTSSTSPVGSLRIMYRSPRTEPELMNTIQPVMSRLLASEFDIILRRRIRAAFTGAGIPLADCRFRYTGSDETSADELFTLMVETAPDRLAEATSLTAGVLAALDSEGATMDEVSFARSVFSEASARDDDNMRLSNARYIDKCLSAYLYGSNLASESTLGAIFSGRRLDIGRERELLNRYISATLDPRRNLHVHAGNTVKPDADSIRAQFARGWEKTCGTPADTPLQSDTTLLQMPSRKVKVRTTSTDPFSGSRMWTFSNGMTVFFKKTADKGAFWYGYMVKGGWTEIPGITAAEAACASDVLALEKVTILSGEHWSDLLAMNGISFKPMITMSDVRFTGAAPSGKLPLVLKSMLAVASHSSADTEAYGRYCNELPLRVLRDKFTAAGTRAILDSTMCPGYQYAAGSMPGMPGKDFAERVNGYLARKGANTHNSIIVLMGDLDENATLRLLCQVLGGFSKGQQRVIRPRPAYPLRECWTTQYSAGNWREKGVTVSLSTRWPFNADGNMTLQVACATLEQELSSALAAKGYRFTVSGEADLLPAEAATIYINCYPVPAGGLPASVSPARPSEALDAVRSCINRLATNEVSGRRLERAKASVIGFLGGNAKNTAAQRDLVLYRNALGRDLGTSFDERVKATTASGVMEFFRQLDKCKCEFVVQ